jgi:hypothetical protein
MMRKDSNRTAGVALMGAALVASILLGGSEVLAVQTGVFAPPDLGQFLLVGQEEGDGDGDGVKETHILRYAAISGDSVFSMTTNGRLWAWSMESPAAEAWDISRNYVIRDSDCDGAFDERYDLAAEFHLPDCLK